MSLKKITLVFALLFIGSVQLQAQDSAETILENASEIAKKQNKNVFVMFHASWCTWCKKMDNRMMANHTKPLFEKNFVIEHLVVKESKKNKHLENAGAEELLIKYKGGNSGIPFWLIFNSDGELLTDSLDENGNNLGCPATPKEVEQFLKKLKQTTSLTDDELKIIYDKFIIKK